MDGKRKKDKDIEIIFLIFKSILTLVIFVAISFIEPMFIYIAGAAVIIGGMIVVTFVFIGAPLHNDKESIQYQTMQEIHSIKEGYACKTCKHCIPFRNNEKQYYQCELWIMAHFDETDIRLKNKACNKYESEDTECKTISLI